MKDSGSSSYFHQLWSRETGLTYIFLYVCVGDFIITPFLMELPGIRILAMIFWMLMLFTGIMVLSGTRTHMIGLSTIPALLIVTRIIYIFTSVSAIEFIGDILEICAYILLIWLVLVKVFGEGPVTMHRIIGSIAVYLLIGNLWAEMFQLVHNNLEGAFNIPLDESSSSSFRTSYLYFSFTTLTTTGYGDFLAVHPLARTLVIIEELIGVLYPVILIGRLVSLRVEPEIK